MHGGLKVRGNIFTGIVVSDKMQRSAVIERRFLRKVAKYERYIRTKSRITAHVPECVKVRIGDIVELGESRKISKTKSFSVLKVVGHKELIPAEAPKPVEAEA
jgi:small subunit ribosomal protein S17